MILLVITGNVGEFIVNRETVKIVMSQSKWITPLKKQCFVTAGAAINMSTLGMAVGYSAILLPQLEKPESKIVIDIDSGSWLASLVAFTAIGGTGVAAAIMHKWGRKPTNILSIVLAIISWLGFSFSTSLTTLYVSRIVQGIAYGMTAAVCPPLIGEYTTPKHRGVFLGVLTLAITFGIMIVHTVGSLTTWKITAGVCSLLCVVSLLIVSFSPESPSWLIHHGRYEQGKKNFIWLRGQVEQEELNSIIEASHEFDKTNWPPSLADKIKLVIGWVRRREFYMPVIIMVHVYGIFHWGGVTFISAFLHDVIFIVCGHDAHVGTVIITVAAQRLVSHIITIFLVQRIRRRRMLMVGVGSSIVMYVIIGIYAYLKDHDIVESNTPVLGAVLIHLQMITVVLGSVALPFMLAGELYPLEHKSFAIAITNVFFDVHFMLSMKTFLYLVDGLGFHGAYWFSGAITLYCLVIALILLPETKDRTLQDIENEFKARGRPRRMVVAETQATPPLTRPAETQTQDQTPDRPQDQTQNRPQDQTQNRPQDRPQDQTQDLNKKPLERN